MAEDIKLGRQLRDFSAAEITVEKREAGGTRLSFSLSSESPVERWFGNEVLMHDTKAIRMERAKSGAMPLLFNHDWDDPVGMIDGARVADGRLVVDAHFFDTTRAKEVSAMVEGGLRNVSIGYQVHEFEERKGNVFAAVDWEPLEGSIVTVPADPSVGIGRSDDDSARHVRVVRLNQVSQTAAPAASQGAVMADTEATVGAVTEQRVQPAALPAQVRQGPSAMEIEQSRVRAIEAICQANKFDTDLRDHWVGSGMSFDKIADDVLRLTEERSKGTKKVAELGLSGRETQRFSMMSAIRAVTDKNWQKAGFELECSRAIAEKLNKAPDPHKFYVPFEVQQRDLTVASASGGGYLVGTQNTSFIEMMRNRSVVYNAGARRLGGLTGNVTVPKQTAAGTAVWLANEASTATESAQTFGQMSLSPKTVGAYTEISRNLLLQSSPDAEGIVTSDLATVCALAVDVGAIRGAGSGGEPQGIVGTSGVGSVTGTSLAAGGILEFQSDVASSNLLGGSLAYVTTPAVAALLMARPELPSTGTTRLWNGNMLEGSMFGLRALTSNQMAAATMLFGDWSQLVVGEWGVLEVEVNPYANFQAGIVGIRALVSIDVGLRYAAAFSYSSSIT